MPQTRPHSAPSAIAKASPTPSMLVWNLIGNALMTGTARIASVAHTAIAAPSTAPNSASATFSVSSRLTMRHGPAPSASRVPTSRWRALARASIRLAVFPHTARSSSSINPCSISSAVPSIRCGPRGASQNGRTSPRTFALVSGYVFASSLIVRSSSACDCAGVLDRARRAERPSNRGATDRPARAIRPAASARASRAPRDRTSASGPCPEIRVAPRR